MKTILMIASLALMTACGAGADHLATAIDNATAAANSTSSSSASTDGNNTNSNSKTASKTKAKAVDVANTDPSSVAQEPADELDGTVWVSECAYGIIHKAAFAKGEETLTIEIYNDEGCKVFQQAQNQYLTYAIRGNEIEFSVSAPGKWVDGAPSQTFTVADDALTFNDNGQTFHAAK